MELVAYLVSKETVGRCPCQDLLVGVARRCVARGGQVIATDNRGAVGGLRGVEPSVRMKYLKTHLNKFIYRNKIVQVHVT